MDAAVFMADVTVPESQLLLAELNTTDPETATQSGTCSHDNTAALKAHAFDREGLGRRGLAYERLIN